MKPQPFLVALLMFLLSATVAGQTQSPSPSPQQQQGGEDVVTVTTNLVQVDVVVLDKDGRQVTNLRPEDFEVQEDGKRQAITNFAYISVDAATSPERNLATATPSAGPNAPTVAPPPLRPEQVRRTITFVVDDLGLSFESIGYVRQALKKFVDEQMQPGDQVAIIRSSGNVGVLQQITTNKQQLYAAIEQVRYYPMGRSGLSPFIEPNIGMQSWEARETAPREIAEFEEFRQDIFAVGTIGILNYVMRGLTELPGRKAVILISEGFKIHTNQGRSERVLAAIKQLADQSNRASAVVYTIDARGLQPLTLTASDKPGINPYGGDPTRAPVIAGPSGQPQNPTRSRAAPDSARVQLTPGERAEIDSVAAFRQLDLLMQQRNAEFFESQSVLSYLAQQTGGLYLRNQNNLASGIQQLMEDQKGYYLIGYRPEEATIDPATGRRRFHKLTVKVKGSGLRVRSRSGFYGVSYEDARKKKATRDEQLTAALVSPFSSGDVHLRLTSLFGDDAKTGSFMRSLLHVNARDLKFTKEPDGSYKAVIDMLITVIGDNGSVVGQPLTNTQTIIAKDKTYEQILKDGLVYILNVPVKQPGAYQLRVAVRDAKSELLGAAGHFIEVPDLTRNRLVLSGIVLLGTDPNAPKAVAASAEATPGQGAGSGQPTDTQDMQASPAVRQLRQGMILSYGYTIYNAQLDKASGRPQLQTQMRMFRDGQLVFTGKVLPYDASQQTDMKRLNAGGRIRVGPDLVPGDYILQVVVTDLLIKDKSRPSTATQVIDFTVVK
ncbi:MAG TPA: VWA domain-containing protein [Pyrinomonadaceae bacterium]|jgi:VWFA-related protein